MWQFIFTGFLVKSIASFDDTVTRIPVLAHLTKTTNGRIAFSIGTLLSLTTILFLAFLFASTIIAIPYRHELIASLIFLLAGAVYLDLFTSWTNSKVEKTVGSEISTHAGIVKLITIGFIVSFITLIDDVIVLMPLFVYENSGRLYHLIGIYMAAFLQIIAVIFFSKYIEAMPYKKEIAALGLFCLSILIWLRII